MLLFPILLALLSASSPPLPQSTELPDEIAVCEAVVLDYLKSWSADSKKAVNYYFEDSPRAGYVTFPEAFFRKYENNLPPFKKTSEFKGRQAGAANTPEWSWSFETPQRVDNDTFKVSGGYFCGGLCALHCDYHAVRKNGKWIVQRSGICTAS
jgi:hypothetical protein